MNANVAPCQQDVSNSNCFLKKYKDTFTFSILLFPCKQISEIVSSVCMWAVFQVYRGTSTLCADPFKINEFTNVILPSLFPACDVPLNVLHHLLSVNTFAYYILLQTLAPLAKVALSYILNTAFIILSRPGQVTGLMPKSDSGIRPSKQGM